MTYKAILIDDEEAAIRNLTFYIQAVSPKIEVVGTANGPLDGLKLIKEHQPDVVFLDVSMPTGSGFEMLNALPEINFKLIFVTAHEEYAIQALREKAFDYVLKPLVSDEFNKVIERLLLALEQPKQDNKQKLFFPTNNGIEIVEIADIQYCIADNVYTNIYLASGSHIIVSKPLKVVEEMLQGNNFLRSHRSYLINVSKVVKYTNEDGGFVHFKSGAQAPVSNSFKSHVMAELS